MNNQKPEPRDKGDGSELDVHSMFFTLQGEGPFAGHRSIFVRLAGCNLQCPGCDTEYTEGRQRWSVADLLVEIITLSAFNNAEGCLVVITGGEPFRQNIGMLVDALVMMGRPVQIESNGVFEPGLVVSSLIIAGKVALVVSPKTQRIHPGAFAMASCFKYVLDHREVDATDGLPLRALEHPAKNGVARPAPDAPVYINPYDAKDEKLNQLNLAAAARSAMQHGYILGVQLHKLIGLE